MSFPDEHRHATRSSMTPGSHRDGAASAGSHAAPVIAHDPSFIRCSSCEYNLTGARVAGTCPECGELVTQTFSLPKVRGVVSPVLCMQCGHDLAEERIDGRCSSCGHPVLTTLVRRGQTREGAVYAPLAITLAVLMMPCTLIEPIIALIFGTLVALLFIPSHWEYQDKKISPLVFHCAAAAALIGVVYACVFFFLIGAGRL